MYKLRSREVEDQIVQDALEILAQRLRYPDAYIKEPSDAKIYVGLKLMSSTREVFACLYLNTRNGVIGYEELFFGTIDQAAVYPRIVVQKSLNAEAAAVILVHNHPSGNPEPSQADIQITQRLKEALATVDIRLLDHFIVGGRDIVSFAEKGLI